MEWEMGPIGRPNSRCHRGRQLVGLPVRCLQPPPHLPLPFSRLLSQTSHMYLLPVQLLPDSPAGRWPRIVSTGPDDLRCPEGLRSPRLSIHKGSAHTRSPPLLLRSAALDWLLALRQ